MLSKDGNNVGEQSSSGIMILFKATSFQTMLDSGLTEIVRKADLRLGLCVQKSSPLSCALSKKRTTISIYCLLLSGKWRPLLLWDAP